MSKFDLKTLLDQKLATNDPVPQAGTAPKAAPVKPPPPPKPPVNKALRPRRRA